MDNENTSKPKHIAIIPDGNRRWARQNNLTPIEGHSAGIDKFNDVLKWAKDHDIKMISFWSFSTENASRDKNEIEGLYNLFNKKLFEGLKDNQYDKHNAKINFIGDLSLFPDKILNKIKQVQERSKKTADDYIVNLFLGYGGRPELLNMVKKISTKVQHGELVADDITEHDIEQELYTKGLPDPDLIIRTSGEMRTSGFMPWQSVYSELYFTNKLWPDYTQQDFNDAITEYQRRKRRFGK